MKNVRNNLKKHGFNVDVYKTVISKLFATMSDHSSVNKKFNFVVEPFI